MNIKKKKNANYNGVWATSWETPVLEDSRANYNNMLFFFFFSHPKRKYDLQRLSLESHFLRW